MSEETQETNKGLTLDDFLPQEEVRIAVYAKSKEAQAFFIFQPLDALTLRKYRQLYNGAPGSRRGNPGEAMRHVFKEKFLRTEGIDVEMNGHADEREFWIKEQRAQLLFDSVMNTYLAESIPDADDVKK